MNTNASQENRPLKFFLFVFVISIPFWLFGGSKLPIPLNLPVSALAAFNPLIAASILSYMRLAGLPLPDPNIPWLMVPVFFFVFFIFAIGEELGYMGYAIDPMENRWGALNASLIMGFVWAILHIIPDVQNQQTLNWILWHRLGTIALRILIVWIYNNTRRSVFSAILFHDMNNLSWALFPNYGSHYNPFIVGVITWLLAAVVRFVWEPKTLTRYRHARVKGG